MFIGKAFANGISMAGIIANKEIMEKEADFPVVRGEASWATLSLALLRRPPSTR